MMTPNQKDGRKDGRPNNRRDNRKEKPSDGFEEKVIQLRRVSKKTKGGNTVSFAALVVVGDRKGQVGTGYGKGRDVQSGIQKAIASAKRNLIQVDVSKDTIPYEIRASYGSASILMKPAPKGAGIIAGGAVRIVIDFVGLKDISAKMLGANNKICNIRCALLALSKLKVVNKKVKE